MISAFPWGAYYEQKAIKLVTSRWKRPSPESSPAGSKAAGLYIICTLAKDEALVKDFGGGSTPSDEKVPGLGAIRDALGDRLGALKRYVAGLDAAGLARTIPGPNNTQRTVGESITLLAWHEAHHQGQIHLTWNLYKAGQGMT